MAVNSKKLKDLFGASDDTSTTKEDIFVDEEDDNSNNFTDIELDEQDDDGLFPPAPVMKNPIAKPITSDNVNADFDFAVRVQADLLNRQQQLIQIAMNNAVDGNARDIEVASQSIEAASNMTEKLISLHEKISKMKAQDNSEQQGNIITGNTINQVIYQGTTADIIEKIKNGTIDAN